MDFILLNHMFLFYGDGLSCLGPAPTPFCPPLHSPPPTSTICVPLPSPLIRRESQDLTAGPSLESPSPGLVTPPHVHM